MNVNEVDDNIDCTDETIMTRKYLKILVKLGKDQFVKDPIEELTLRNTTLEEFSQSLLYTLCKVFRNCRID